MDSQTQRLTRLTASLLSAGLLGVLVQATAAQEAKPLQPVPAATNADSRKDSSRKAADSARKPASDPMRPFLAAWMSSRDYELLIKKGERKPGVNAFESQSGNPGEYLDKILSDRQKKELQARQSARQPGQENPFLQNLALPSPSAPRIAADTSGNIKQDKMIDNIETPPPPKEEPKKSDAELTKERLKQKEDKKYFPQLKRF